MEPWQRELLVESVAKKMELAHQLRELPAEKRLQQAMELQQFARLEEEDLAPPPAARRASPTPRQPQ